MIETQTAIKAIIQVKGFHDAKNWIYRLVQDGVAKCAECEKPAVGVFWNDAAEWYCECAQHRTQGQMWGGHTRWNPRSFSKILVFDKAKAWYDALPPDEKKRVKLIEFDATDWWGLLVDYSEPVQIHYFLKKDNFAHFARILALKDGRFAYETRREWGGDMVRTSHCDELKAPFDSIELAIEAARMELEGNA